MELRREDVQRHPTGKHCCWVKGWTGAITSWMSLLMESKSILKKRFEVGGSNPQVTQFLWFLLLTKSVDFILFGFSVSCPYLTVLIKQLLASPDVSQFSFPSREYLLSPFSSSPSCPKSRRSPWLHCINKQWTSSTFKRERGTNTILALSAL